MDSLKDLWKGFLALYKDKLRFYSLKGVEKTSLFLGLIATICIISVLCMLVMVFASVGLAHFLNAEFNSFFLGYLCVSGIYLIIMLLTLWWVANRRTPLLTSVFVRTLISLFNIPEDEDK